MGVGEPGARSVGPALNTLSHSAVHDAVDGQCSDHAQKSLLPYPPAGAS